MFLCSLGTASFNFIFNYRFFKIKDNSINNLRCLANKGKGINSSITCIKVLVTTNKYQLRLHLSNEKFINAMDFTNIITAH